ncbi:biotin-dependent carboxyltransferase family protein [Alteromonas sp. 1_MG-2023]|uniref:5-oxoprolinase subunit C family protein n=1 Tax=Alteromonas sp. 1_MG-2023 TaxID=3062669 RepID=UPI0026E40CD3|nr:biotin-dependent carboxyltransferase family protein [Alteromonas sp. 1_MG-2023]MDO6568057.1 biotin-dependent carboxyltransferase family protein [Alteromonas sp. 1_MG-2023]
MKVSVEQNGLLSLIIDSGRQGKQHQGFCQSGPMDEEAYWWANYLAGNHEGTPCIEVMGRAEFICDANAHMAATGRSVLCTVNGQSVSPFETIFAKSGDRVCIESEHMGSKAYLAIQGKWCVPTPLTSASTVSREAIGGLENKGLPLAAGDKVNIEAPTLRSAHRALATEHWPQYDLSEPLALILGYQEASFSALNKARLFSSEYKVTNNINRMGYRLSGTPIQSGISKMRSEAIHIGAMQIPPDGQPIVMMRDRQTLGGYPKLGSVSLLDVNRLAQTVPGETVTFISQHYDDARAAFLLNWQKRLRLTGE